jgi:PAS domain S-box-containing protein
MPSRFFELLPETRPDVDVPDLVDECVVVFDLNQKVLAWNTGAERLYGWDRDEVIGNAIQAAVRCAPSESLVVILAKVRESGVWRGEFTRVTKGGDTVIVQAKWSLRRDSAGVPIDIVEISRDITEIRRSERRYRDFFHFLPVALLQLEGRTVVEVFAEARAQGVVDFATHQKEHPEILERLLDGFIIAELNQRAIETLRGKSASEFVGLSAKRYWTESPDVIRDIMAARYSGEKSHQALARIVANDGSIIEVLFCVAFGPIGGDQRVSLVGLFDVSDRVQAQEMLAKLQADMAHAARVSILGELTASIAHEVSQPLTAIEANTEASLLWLGQATPNIPEVRDLCNSTAVEVQRAADILHRIRAMAVRAAPIKASVDLNIMIEEAVLFLRHELTRHDVEVRLELDPALPYFYGDRVQLQQVMVNLGVNAIQSMAAPSMTAQGSDPRVMSIRTSRTPEGGHLIEVGDTGPGIDREALELLFEGFFTTKPRGMGIGLAICRSIIESHGGQISARNRDDGHGAKFTIQLPRDPQ